MLMSTYSFDMMLSIWSKTVYLPLGAQIATCLSLPMNSTSLSLHPPFLETTDIRCFGPGTGRLPITVDSCRSTLNHLRGLPNYRKVQDFIEDRCPKVPDKPPYVWHAKASDCAIQIASGDPLVIDRFSFEQARALLTEAIEVCQAQGGYGGFAPIGRRIGWEVKAIGYRYEPPDMNGALPVGIIADGSSSAVNFSTNSTALE